jgi:hypothetical protein
MPISTGPAGMALVGLCASDGSVAWQRPIGGRPAFAPDGTLIVAGTFSRTLALGGTTMPVTSTGDDGFVAALDPVPATMITSSRVRRLGCVTTPLTLAARRACKWTRWPSEAFVAMR